MPKEIEISSGQPFVINRSWDSGTWVPRPRFAQGRIIVTMKALTALKRAGQDADFFLNKHIRGDWGIADPHQSAGNELAIEAGRAIRSVHKTLLGETVIIVTNESRTRTTVKTLAD
jgi:hypothetical protein